MGKMLTISVAAYNVEKYLDKLMRSVIDADVIDLLDVIIINDGSKDGTAQKALGYQRQYPGSVRLIDKENGGFGSTINCGIRNATGKYYRSLDGDDWVNSENLANLVQDLNDIDADIILSNLIECYEDGRQIICDRYPKFSDKTYYSFDDFSSRIGWMQYHTVIFRTAILQEHDICMDEHCFYVDTEFLLYPIPYVNRVFFSKAPIYCYRIGLSGQSISAEGRRKHIADGFTVSKSMIRYYKEHSSQLTPAQRKRFVDEISNHSLWHIHSLLLFPASIEKKREITTYERFLKKTVPDCYYAMANKGETSKDLKQLRKTHYLSYYRLIIRRIIRHFKHRKN